MVNEDVCHKLDVLYAVQRWKWVIFRDPWPTDPFPSLMLLLGQVHSRRRHDSNDDSYDTESDDDDDDDSDVA